MQADTRQTQNINSSILVVLNHAVAFGVLFSSLASDATLDLSRASLGTAARHRSRRARRERRNVVSFSQEAEEWSSSSDDGDEEEMAQSLASLRTKDADEEDRDEGIAGRMDKIAVELDAHVRLIRRGVETLAMGSDDDAGVFGVLSFLLQDWDQ
jgi:gamma-tubulin complex component 5